MPKKKVSDAKPSKGLLSTEKGQKALGSLSSDDSSYIGVCSNMDLCATIILHDFEDKWKRIWFFPNILAEEATFSELFQFWPQPSKDEEEPPKWTARMAFATVTVLAIWVSIRHAPDEAARARYQKRVSNIIDDVLEWSPRLALSGKMQEKPSVFDIVQNNDTVADENTSETDIEPGHSQDREINDLQNQDQQSDLEDSVSHDFSSEPNREEEMTETK